MNRPGGPDTARRAGSLQLSWVVGRRAVTGKLLAPGPVAELERGPASRSTSAHGILSRMLAVSTSNPAPLLIRKWIVRLK